MVFDILEKIGKGEHDEEDISVLHENARNGNLNDDHIEKVLDNLEKGNSEEEMARTLFHHVKSGKELSSDNYEKVLDNIKGEPDFQHIEKALSDVSLIHSHNIDFDKNQEKFKEHMGPLSDKLEEVQETPRVEKGLEAAKRNMNFKALSIGLGEEKEDFLKQFDLESNKEKVGKVSVGENGSKEGVFSVLSQEDLEYL